MEWIIATGIPILIFILTTIYNTYQVKKGTNESRLSISSVSTRIDELEKCKSELKLCKDELAYCKEHINKYKDILPKVDRVLSELERSLQTDES